jgi:hypothetical protein
MTHAFHISFGLGTHATDAASKGSINQQINYRLLLDHLMWKNGKRLLVAYTTTWQDMNILWPSVRSVVGLSDSQSLLKFVSPVASGRSPRKCKTSRKRKQTIP